MFYHNYNICVLKVLHGILLASLQYNSNVGSRFARYNSKLLSRYSKLKADRWQLQMIYMSSKSSDKQWYGLLILLYRRFKVLLINFMMIYMYKYSTVQLCNREQKTTLKSIILLHILLFLCKENGYYIFWNLIL